MEDYLEKIFEHKHALLFVGGVATALVGKKILESDCTKDFCAKGMAQVMSVKKEAEETFQNMKDNAEDICADADDVNKKQVYIDSEDKE